MLNVKREPNFTRKPPSQTDLALLCLCYDREDVTFGCQLLLLCQMCVELTYT